MPSFSNLRAEAQERWAPEEGGEYLTVVVDVRLGVTRNDYPSIGLWLEVIDGEDSGERFWDNTYFSASKAGNNMSFSKLEAVSIGLDKAFWAQDPDEDAIKHIAMGCKVKVQATYEENKDGGDPWLRCIYVPITDKVEI